MLRLFSAIALTLLWGLTAFAAGDYHGLQKLGGSMVTWNDDRLTAELKNAPVKGVLKDLISGEGFGCEVKGDLQGTVSLVIDDLTVEGTIQKIMRNFRYDYTMILAEPESSEDGHAVVSELTIYQGDNTVRFAKVPKGMLTAEPKRIEPVPSPEEVSPIGTSIRTTVAAEEDLEKLDREIKGFMDEMVSEKKMTQEEYEKALRTINTERK